LNTGTSESSITRAITYEGDNYYDYNHNHNGGRNYQESITMFNGYTIKLQLKPFNVI